MANINIIYWSGTYNTKTMAELIERGIRDSGKEVSLKPVAEATKEDALSSDILVLGCPSMGDEVLEESEMEPFIESIENEIKGKKVVLFGSYGWGDGEWMRNWEERMRSKGAEMPLDSVIAEYSPSGDSEEACIDLGIDIASI